MDEKIKTLFDCVKNLCESRTGSSTLHLALFLLASSLRTAWAGFIEDTLYGKTLDDSTDKFKFSN